MFEVWRKGKSIKKKNLAVLVFVSNMFKNECEDEAKHRKLKQHVGAFTSKISEKWKKCKRSLRTFTRANSNWLGQSIDMFSLPVEATSEILPNPSTESRRRGRPTKDFTEVSNQSKRRKILPLLQKYSPEQLIFATKKSLEASGRRAVGRIIEATTSTDDIEKKNPKTPKALPIKYTPEEALTLYTDGQFTKKSYIMMQQGVKCRNAQIYPNYNIILEEKKKCRCTTYSYNRYFSRS